MSTGQPRARGRPTGRRPGDSATRDAIAAAARQRFAEAGYDRASLRAIAADAGVDQKLIAHYFGSKQRLFVAAVGLPADPLEVLPVVLEGGDEAVIAARLATIVTTGLQQPDLHQRLTAVVRATATEPAVARAMREFFPDQVLPAVEHLLGPGDPRLRLNLFGSQIVGAVMGRYVIGVDPLATLPAEEVGAAISPTLARYLVGDFRAGAPVVRSSASSPRRPRRA